MSELIGLPAELIEQHNLRIDLVTFRRNIVADKGLVAGRLDTRFTTAAPLPVQNSAGFFASEDPAMMRWNLFGPLRSVPSCTRLVIRARRYISHKTMQLLTAPGSGSTWSLVLIRLFQRQM